MSKNSRPDIQVLEARVERLKSQLEEYSDLKVYGVTKKRLANLAVELDECISVITSLVGDDAQPAPKTITLSEPEEYVAAKDDFEDDLSDVASIDFLSSSIPSDENYLPKDIMTNYTMRMKECGAATTGIIQINQFCRMLEQWYSVRFSRGGTFRYKAQRIHEWVDLMIVAAGEALNQRTFPAFKAEVDKWISDIDPYSDKQWVLPKVVMEFKDSIKSRWTKEAILIERIVKPILYDDNFYPSKLHSIEEIVITSTTSTEEDLSIDNLIESAKASGVVVSSSFDINKYKGGQADV